MVHIWPSWDPRADNVLPSSLHPNTFLLTCFLRPFLPLSQSLQQQLLEAVEWLHLLISVLVQLQLPKPQAVLTAELQTLFLIFMHMCHHENTFCKDWQNLSPAELPKHRTSFFTSGFSLPHPKHLRLGECVWRTSLIWADEYVKRLCGCPDEKRKHCFVPWHLVGEAGDSSD